MKIGIDIRAIGRQRTGDETYTLGLVQGLLERDQKNEYFLYTNTKDSAELEKIEKKINQPASRNFKIVSVLPASKAFWTFFALPAEIRKNPVDILHVQYITPLWGLGPETKLITTIHDVSFARIPEMISPKDRYFLKILIPLSFRRADKIIGVSKFTADEIIDAYKTPRGKVAMVYNGGADSRFSKEVSEEMKKQVLGKFDLLGQNQNYLLYVGTLQPRKNIPGLMRGFVELKKKRGSEDKVKDLKLAIGGKINGHNYDPKIDRLFGEIKKENPVLAREIRFLDYIPDEDMPVLFQNAQVFCYASNYEGYGLQLIESMISETPVACSDDDCFREITTDSGAVFFDQNNPSDIAEKIWLILNNENLRSKLIENGIRRARDFSWENCAQETLKIYESLKIE